MTLSPLNRRILGYFLNYWKGFAIGAFFLLATNFLGLQIPALIGQAIAKMQADGTDVLDATRQFGLAIIVFAIGAGIARVLSRVFIFNAGREIEFDVRNDLYARLTRLSSGWYGSMPTGDLTSRVTNDVNYVRLLYAITFLHVLNTLTAYVLALQKMVVLDWSLTLICLAPFPAILLVVRQIIKALFNQTKIVQTELSNLSSRVQENLAGCTIVRTYATEDFERTRFQSLNDNFVAQNIRLVTIRGALQAMMSLLAGVGTMVVLLVGSGRVADGTLTLGQFVEFNGYVVALAFPTIGLGWVFSVWNRGVAAFERVFEILEAPIDIADPDQPQILPADLKKRGHIQLKNVDFAYPNGFQALTDINLDIPAGSRVAIVGRTGSGKSTLIRLICRLWDPSSGTVTLDGIPLTELDIRETRSEIGVVPQDPFLFSMSIADNVRFGLDALEFDDTIRRQPPTLSLLGPTSSDQTQRVQEALTIAGLGDDLNAFKEGAQTMVGERGVTLSGGQKQRVTIARALVMDPRILLLDDALASVDTQTETRILDHLERIMDGRTTVLVTHRFNALGRMDRIFVVDHGRIVESGTHDELLRQSGTYAELYENQKLQEELEA